MEKAYLLALLFVMFSRAFITFPNGVPDQVWYTIVLIPDPCLIPNIEMSLRQRNANAVKAQCTHIERRESAVKASRECRESPTRTP